MTWQQKVWKYGKLFYRACSPVLVLLLLPSASRLLVITFFGTDPDDANGEFYYALGLYCYLWLFIRKQKKRGRSVSDWIEFRSWKVDRGKIGFYFTRGIALNLMLTAVLSLMSRFSWMRSYEERTRDFTDSTNAILIFAAVCVLAPIAEEITLRGVMLRELLTTFTPKTAILIVSAVFAIGHGNLLWTLYTFCFGIYLAKTAIRENMRLIFPIVLHCGFNLPSIVAYFVNNSRRAIRLWEQYPALYLCYGLLGVGMFAWSVWLSRRYLLARPDDREGEKAV